MPATIWCPIHNHVTLANAKAADDCSFCQQAARQKEADIRTLNSATTIGRCGFCGGPTPCLRD